MVLAGGVGAHGLCCKRNKDLQFTYEKLDLVPLAEAIAKEAPAPGGPCVRDRLIHS